MELVRTGRAGGIVDYSPKSEAQIKRNFKKSVANVLASLALSSIGILSVGSYENIRTQSPAIRSIESRVLEAANPYSYSREVSLWKKKADEALSSGIESTPEIDSLSSSQSMRKYEAWKRDVFGHLNEFLVFASGWYLPAICLNTLAHAAYFAKKSKSLRKDLPSL